MTEGQLNTDLSYSRPRGLDSETEYNTRYNKFELVEKRSTERRGSDENSERYKVYSYVSYIDLIIWIKEKKDEHYYWYSFQMYLKITV